MVREVDGAQSRSKLVRGARGVALALMALALIDQVVQFTALGDGWLFGQRVAPYDPPLFNAAQQRSLERLDLFASNADPARARLILDPELGWVTHGADYDEHGARRGLEARPGARRIVVVGCSFAHGDEVENDETWEVALERRRPDLHLFNLGVGGYGLDQALLRHRRDGAKLAPDELWLVLMPDAALRTVSTYAPALRHYAISVAFKPRFELEDGRLELVPNPGTDAGRIVELLDDQRRFLAAVGEHDLFVRRWSAAYAPAGSHWSHRSALARLALTQLERGARSTQHWIGDERSEPYELVRALVLEAATSAPRMRLVVLPSRADLEAGRYWARLVDDLAARGIECIEPSDGLADLDSAWMPQGHYSPSANETVAEALARRLE